MHTNKMKKAFLVLMAALFIFECGGKCSGGSGSSSSTISTVTGGTNTSSALGTNLDWGSWLAEFPFKDIFKQSSPWIISATGAPAPLTAAGWPDTSEPVSTSMYLGVDGHYPKGRYNCFYDGEGTLEFSGGASVLSQSSGQIVFDANTDEAIWLQLSDINTSNPVRNIRVIMPGYESDYLTEPFYPGFLERLGRYKVIRFGGWQNVLSETSTTENWADRPLTTHATQAGDRGVALEYMIQLANALDADPWFNMPYLATDDYVTQFATLVRDQLDSSLDVYIEYSNEVWNDNPAFPQSQYANAQGLALNLALEFPDSTTAELTEKTRVAGRRFYSQRSVEIFNIWEQVFGSTDRLVRVLATHSEQADLAGIILDWQNAYQYADALAIGGYFGVEIGVGTAAPSTVDGIFAALPASIDLTLGYLVQNLDYATARGLPVIAYEGGQHLIASTAGTDADNFVTANRDPRMGTMYTQLLDGWRSFGGQLFMHLESGGQYNENGSWGALEWYDETSSPKHDALMQWMENNPQWW